MKKLVEYHEFTVTFVVRKSEAKRCAPTLARLAEFIASGITGNATESMDAEDLVVKIDGRTRWNS